MSLVREFKKQPPPVKSAWIVAILVVMIILALAVYGLISLIFGLTS